MKTAINPQTGERIYFNEAKGEWAPMPAAPGMEMPVSPPSPQAMSANLNPPQNPQDAMAMGRAGAAMEVQSPLQAGLIGAGKKTNDIVQGAQDLIDTPQSFLGDKDAQMRMRDRKGEMAYQESLYSPLADKFPVSTALGESAPYFAAPMKVPGMSLVASSALVPGLLGFTEYGTPQERMTRGAIAAGLGLLAAGIPAALGGKAYPDKIDPYLKEVNEAGERLGFTPLPSVRRGGDRALQIAEARMESNARQAPKIADIKDGNVRNLTKVAAKEIGLDGVDRLSPDRLTQAREKIGAVFENAGKGKDIALDQQFYDDLDVIEAKYAEGAGRRSKKIANTISDLKDMGKRFFMSPAEYKRQTSALVKDAMSISAKDAAKADALLDARKALDDAFDRGVPGELKDLKKARDQWRTMLMVESAVNEAGDVSYNKLANVVRRKDDWGYLRGNKKSDLYDALRFFKAFPANFGNSGTTQRGLQPSLMSDIKSGAASGAGAGALFDMASGGSAGGTGTMVGGLVGGTMGAARPVTDRAAAALYTSKALTRGLLSPSAKKKLAKAGVDLSTESGQGLLSRSLARLITPASLMSVP